MSDVSEQTPRVAIKPAIIYTRVSGQGQARESDDASFDVQEAACRALAAQRGFAVAQVVREVYRGSELFDRPQLTQVRADLHAGRYGALIVFTTSRLARDPVHQAIIIEEAMRGGAQVEIVNEPLDTSPEGMLIAYVRGYAAQIDLARIKAQLMGGRRKRVEMGKIHNAGSDLYGYRRDREAGVRVIEPTEAAIVTRIYDLCVTHHLGVKTIARMLHEEGVPTPGTGKRARCADSPYPVARWSGSMVRNILRNPAYRGETLVWRYRSTLARPSPTRRTQYQTRLRPPEEALRLPDGVTPAIVAEETWYAAQDALTQRVAQSFAQRTAGEFLLRGLVRCGVCGRGMETRTVSTWKATGAYLRIYRCASHQSLERGCGGSRIRADDIETWVWQEVRAILADPATLARELLASEDARNVTPAQTESLATERERVLAALQRVERLQARTLARYNTVDDEAVFPWSLAQAELARLDGERQRHTVRLADLDVAVSAQQRVTTRHTTLEEQIRMLAAALESHPTTLATLAERRAFLTGLNAALVGNGREWRLIVQVIAGDGATTLVRRHAGGTDAHDADDASVLQ